LIKSDTELSYIREACHLTDQTFSYLCTIIRPGVTEWSLRQQIIDYIQKNGGGIAFTPIVAFGPHSSMPHYGTDSDSMRQTILQKDDTLLIDFGASYKGYCSDMTRTMSIGSVDPRWHHAYKTVLHSQTATIAYLQTSQARYGNLADTIARKKIIEKKHIPYMHTLGHGLGLDIHESPRLTIKKRTKLTPGMVLTVEPGIYIPGQFGIRIEDTVYITETGVDVLTKSPKTQSVIS